MKVVINRCHGGFGLSEKGVYEYAKRKGVQLYPEKGSLFTTYWTVPPDDEGRVRAEAIQDSWHTSSQQDRISSNEYFTQHRIYDSDIPRDDAVLVEIVEALGPESWGDHAELKVVEIPDGVKWQIEEYDGLEWVAEAHRTWS